MKRFTPGDPPSSSSTALPGLSPQRHPEERAAEPLEARPFRQRSPVHRRLVDGEDEAVADLGPAPDGLLQAGGELLMALPLDAVEGMQGTGELRLRLAPPCSGQHYQDHHHGKNCTDPTEHRGMPP
jgi:hypothetical protein